MAPHTPAKKKPKTSEPLTFAIEVHGETYRLIVDEIPSAHDRALWTQAGFAFGSVLGLFGPGKIPPPFALAAVVFLAKMASGTPEPFAAIEERMSYADIESGAVAPVEAGSPPEA